MFLKTVGTYIHLQFLDLSLAESIMAAPPPSNAIFLFPPKKTRRFEVDSWADRLSYHNIAIVYCNDHTIYDAVVLAVTIHEYCKTLPYIIFSGSDAGISGLVGIFPFAFAIKMASCWDHSASASIFDIPIPGPLQYASVSHPCCFYRSLSGLECAYSASSRCSPPVPF
jgi:hypothetical protein